ncbi:catalase [Acidovorax lacteus]|uniref:Catalase family protein n=1 Tax=Acidovorax lacteus TaxID=1924988 RepID=A0ABP8L4E6_9BURK
MTAIPLPSTDWAERIGADEPERFADYARRFAAIQAQRAQRYGPGRTLHRKPLAALQGTLQVLGDLPDFARHGLFAQPGTYATWVRLSNGGLDRAPDRVPDIRGFALRVLGVQGPSALGGDATPSQDFALINQEAFAFATTGPFVALVEAAARGPAALLGHLVRTHGLWALPRELAKFKRTVGRPFGGFATQAFYSAAPIACGPYAVRVRLVPAASNGAPDEAAAKDWGADMARRLRAGSLHWDLQLQYFASEAITPIEDASVDWPTPYTTVAKLALPQQNLDSAAAQAFATQVEGSVFDPWQALAAHRPLGEVQRARKVVYYASQQGRGVA